MLNETLIHARKIGYHKSSLTHEALGKKFLSRQPRDLFLE